MEATLVHELLDPADPVFAVSQGNMEVLGDGHSVLGYGSVPKLKEFDKNGSVVLDVQWGEPKLVQSYRDYKAEWIGKPSAPPSVFACQQKTANETRVYMSWNGATEHQSWTVFGGTKEKDLAQKATAKRSGFETVVTVPHSLQFVKVEASGSGIETGVSSIFGVSEEC